MNPISDSTGGVPDWYSDGIEFECIEGCSKCCGGSPGEVYLSDEEAHQIADHLGLKKKHFIDKYTRTTKRGAPGLIDMPNYDCVFLTSTGCKIYEIRPKQCRTYPFWSEIVCDEKAWIGEKIYCPGIGTGKLYSWDEIQGILADKEIAKGQKTEQSSR